MMNYSFYLVFLAILGAICGSFLNVCIYRMPREKSIIFPGSFCPSCKKHVKWFDNIPIFSFFILKARCRFCRARISFKYPVVEFLTMMFFIISFIRWYPTDYWGVFFLRDVFVLSSLIVVFFVDLEFKIIPDEITYSGIVLAFLLNILFPHLIESTTRWQSFLKTLIGFLTGGGILLLLGYAGELIFKKESMGMGDVKLLAMLGAFFGFLDAILIIIAGSFIGAIVGGLCMMMKKVKFGQQIPFGPFLAIACVVIMFWGDILIRFYLNLVLVR